MLWPHNHQESRGSESFRGPLGQVLPQTPCGPLCTSPSQRSGPLCWSGIQTMPAEGLWPGCLLCPSFPPPIFPFFSPFLLLCKITLGFPLVASPVLILFLLLLSLSQACFPCRFPWVNFAGFASVDFRDHAAGRGARLQKTDTPALEDPVTETRKLVWWCLATYIQPVASFLVWLFIWNSLSGFWWT